MPDFGFIFLVAALIIIAVLIEHIIELKRKLSKLEKGKPITCTPNFDFTVKSTEWIIKDNAGNQLYPPIKGDTMEKEITNHGQTENITVTLPPLIEDENPCTIEEPDIVISKNGLGKYKLTMSSRLFELYDSIHPYQPNSAHWYCESFEEVLVAVGRIKGEIRNYKLSRTWETVKNIYLEEIK